MITLLIMLLLVFLWVDKDPAIEVTREKHVILFWNYNYKRRSCILFKL